LSLDELDCQKPVDFQGIVTISGRVPTDNVFESSLSHEWPTQRARIQENVPHMRRQFIPIVDAEMMKLMAPQEEFFQMQPGTIVVHAGQPLRHAMIVGMFRLERKFLQQMPGSPHSWKGGLPESPIRSNAGQGGITIANQSKR
jgi:hypothetical protein